MPEKLGIMIYLRLASQHLAMHCSFTAAVCLMDSF